MIPVRSKLMHNLDYIIGSTITGSGAAIANIQLYNEYIKAASGTIAIIVGLLTLIKLYREVFKDKKKPQ